MRTWIVMRASFVLEAPMSSDFAAEKGEGVRVVGFWW